MRISEVVIAGTPEKCASINLILGTNNTGKSTFIRELEQAAVLAVNKNNKWIQGVTIELENAKSKINKLYPFMSGCADFHAAQQELSRDGRLAIFDSPDWNPQVFQAINELGDARQIYIAKPEEHTQDRAWHYFRFFSRMSVSIQNCVDRLVGPFSTQIQRIDEPYRDVVHYLHSNPDVFAKIVEHIRNVFSVGIGFDNLQQGQKDIRIIPAIPIPTTFPDLRREAEFWRDHSPLLSNQGDGLRAYLKILYALFNPAKDIVIIDEPEAFLHSPQRRSLGRFIAENAAEGKQIFIATHDSEFLRGVLTSANEPTQVIHLKHDRELWSYNINPLVIGRSQNTNELVLNSYFNKLTVLCEGEDDRMSYQYASQVFFPSETVDTYFLGQNGKGDLFAVFRELKNLRIRVEAIVDIDVLYSGECIGIATTDPDRDLLTEVKESLNVLPPEERKLFKANGVASLEALPLRAKVENAIRVCKMYNVNVVPIGELESWIETLPTPKRLVQSLRNEIDSMSSSSKKVALREFVGRTIQ